MEGNVHRFVLIGLLDYALSFDADLSGQLTPLLSSMERGRADLYNLGLGHVSRSYLVWPYMKMAVKEAELEPAAPAAPAPASSRIERELHRLAQALAQALKASNWDEIARIQQSQTLFLQQNVATIKKDDGDADDEPNDTKALSSDDESSELFSLSD